jgi:hypothetical protein
VLIGFEVSVKSKTAEPRGIRDTIEAYDVPTKQPVWVSNAGVQLLA